MATLQFKDDCDSMKVGLREFDSSWTWQANELRATGWSRDVEMEKRFSSPSVICHSFVLDADVELIECGKSFVNITHDYSKSDMEISTGYGLFSDEDVPAVRSKPGHQTRFNIDDADLFEVEYCDGIVAASAIFETEAYMKNSSSLNEKKKVGIWRVVIVRNLPYKDARRNGKRNNASFAISRHYRRFYVFKEVEANKLLGNTTMPPLNQVEFYKREGLTPNSEAKLPITSDVPEGCVIIKEHIPITNLS
ncbi:hypothetical protein GIB67_028017 [Kingdonia uniflora]|uniref:TOD1/MUCI70 glycosyltransferase-like domain-containing protein n=1 Tax=Kingdonia uniflora TaxID=39325 RepID=A0A7J7P4S1_9MAGN|nr:hypothetical protein GIB67_028017 [Kingdonia uniflora]